MVDLPAGLEAAIRSEVDPWVKEEMEAALAG